MTLATLRTLLERARGPGVERITDRSPEGIARAYLPRAVWLVAADGSPFGVVAVPSQPAGGFDGRALDLTDPGTVHALLVALALAHGLDPGPMGLSVQWFRLLVPGPHKMWRWVVKTATGEIHFTNEGSGGVIRWAPNVAWEPDPIKALVMACELAAQ